VTLKCDTADAKIEYSLDNATWKTYTGPFEMLGGTVYLKASGGSLLPYEGAIVFGEPPAAQWEITASSFDPEEGEAVFAVDGNADTYWHSQWRGGTPKHPHHLIIDFKKPLDISGVVYTARQDMPNGRVKDYEIYLSTDGQNWGEPVLKGQFRERSRRPQVLRLEKPAQAQYLKFVALNEVNGEDYASVAELDVVKVGQEQDYRQQDQ
jgi:beta-galactosidase